MKRITIALATVALAAAALVGLSGVASARETEPYAASKRTCPRCRPRSSQRKRLNIAMKCDSPLFGNIGARSENAGFDVEIAKWFALRFGKSNCVTYTCVTTPAREPALTTGRVDMVIATSPIPPTVTRGSTSRGRTTRQRDDCPFRTALPSRSGVSPARRSSRPAARSTTAG